MQTNEASTSQSSPNETLVGNQKKPETINIEKLKKFVLENLPITSALRDAILSEADSVPSNEYVGLMKGWLKLLKFDTQAKHIKKEAMQT